MGKTWRDAKDFFDNLPPTINLGLVYQSPTQISLLILAKTSPIIAGASGPVPLNPNIWEQLKAFDSRLDAYTINRYDFSIIGKESQTYTIGKEFTFSIPTNTQTPNILFFSCSGYKSKSRVEGKRGEKIMDDLKKEEAEFSKFEDTLNLAEFEKENEFKKLDKRGKIGAEILLQDILNKHTLTPFHAICSLGDFFYNDGEDAFRTLNDTIETEGQLKDAVMTSFFNYVTKLGLLGFMPNIVSQIPMINIRDDHEVIDNQSYIGLDPVEDEFMIKFFKWGYALYLLFLHHDTNPLTTAGINLTSPDKATKPFNFSRKIGNTMIVGVDTRNASDEDSIVFGNATDIDNKYKTEILDTIQEGVHIIFLISAPFIIPVRFRDSLAAIFRVKKEDRLDAFNRVDRDKERNRIASVVLATKEKFPNAEVSVITGTEHYAWAGQMASGSGKDKKIIKQYITSALMNIDANTSKLQKNLAIAISRGPFGLSRVEDIKNENISAGQITDVKMLNWKQKESGDDDKLHLKLLRNYLILDDKEGKFTLYYENEKIEALDTITTPYEIKD